MPYRISNVLAILVCPLAIVACLSDPRPADPEFNLDIVVEPASLPEERTLALTWEPGTLPISPSFETGVDFGPINRKTISLVPDEQVDEICIDSPINLIDQDTEEILATFPAGTCFPDKGDTTIVVD